MGGANGRAGLRDLKWLRRLHRRVKMWCVRKWLGLDGRRVHPTCYFHFDGQISRDLRAHEFAYIGYGCQIGPRVEIGAYTMFAPKVSIVGGDHVMDKAGTPIIFAGRPPMPRTVIGRDCWLGFGVTVISGVTIGDGSVVAAGAVVSKDIPPMEVWGGVPAKKIRDRFPNEADRDLHLEMLKRTPVEGQYAGPLQTGD